MKIQASWTREQVAALICNSLARADIEVVLCGGAVVSIYAQNEYASLDLDFVPTGLSRRVAEVMEELGFREHNRHWKHAETPYGVEFPAGPVQIGSQVVRDFARRETEQGTLLLLTPTDCVMDRLAWYYWDHDLQALRQALDVALCQPIDLLRVEAWSNAEGAGDRYAEFLRRLERERSERQG